VPQGHRLWITIDPVDSGEQKTRIQNMLGDMDDHIADMPPLIRTPRDLFMQWQAMMGDLGFLQRMLWFTFIAADGEAVPVIQQIELGPAAPDGLLLDNLMYVCREILDSTGNGDGTAAFLLSRPGAARITSLDRDWAAGLVDAASRSGVALQPIHLATDERLTVFAADDLIR